MKKLIAIGIIFGISVAMPVHAANPASKEYVDTQDQKLQAQINNISTFQVGQYYQGGVIYWLDPNQSYQHGLIADINDQLGGASYAWDTQTGGSVTNATGNKAYAGKNSPGGNTYIILNAIGGMRGQAANACATSQNQGYSDWYLPSQSELNQMYALFLTITQTALAHAGSEFADINNGSSGNYWSSTEQLSGASASNAWNFGYSGVNASKTTLYSVRCIRAF